MAKIIAPNKDYAGVSAGVAFSNGEGRTDNEHLIHWFRDHGYTVESESEKDQKPRTVKKPARPKTAGR